MDRFQQLLWDLGDLLDVPLHVDGRRACRIVVEDRIALQIELDSAEEHLVIGARIADVAPGAYRERLLIEAMKHNHALVTPTLAFLGKTGTLALCDRLPLQHLDAEELAATLSQYVDHITAWRAAIENGTPLPTAGEPPPTHHPSPLDFR